MKRLIEQYEARLDAERVTGYAVVIVGTRRSAYLTAEGATTYREAEAFIGTKDEAAALMNQLYTPEPVLWHYARLLPVVAGGGLPTVSGY